ncbi:MAG: hypothetical protein ACK59M_18615 [Pseudomonadota bacterium]|jgi:hypothetical protein
MTAKKPASGGALAIDRRPDDTSARATARTVLRPTIGAAIATQAVYGKKIGGELLDVGELSNELVEQCGKVHGGDLKRMESMMVAQATTLDALFNRLTQRAMEQEYLKQFETYMRLALKAQGQARATVEALAEIKNPRPVAFVKQANVGTNVQVNNGPIGPYAGARVRENDADAPSGLLEASDGDRLDTRAQGAAGRGDPALEAVDAQHRPEDRER